MKLWSGKRNVILRVEELEDRLAPAGTWVPIGPAPQGQLATVSNPSFGGAGGDVSGRVSALAYLDGYYPNGQSALLLGAASGGVWLSGGLGANTIVWTPTTDQNGFGIFDPNTGLGVGALRSGSLAVDPFNPPRVVGAAQIGNGTVYAATGEANNQASALNFGTGVLRSTTGGNTWFVRATGTAPNETRFAGHSIPKIFVDPTNDGHGYDPMNPNPAIDGKTLYMCVVPPTPQEDRGRYPHPEKTQLIAADGLYKSPDGGQTWTKINIPNLQQQYVTDLEYTRSGNQLTLFVAIGNFNGNGGNGIYRRIGNDPWQRLPLPADYVPTNAGRMVLAADHRDLPGTNRTVYAAASAKFVEPPPGQNPAAVQLLGVYRSNDNGDTPFVRVAAAAPAPLSASGQMYFNLMIGIQPNNPLEVYLGGQQQLMQSTNGGTTWTAINVGPNFPHDDYHAIAFGGGKVYVGCDGGVWEFDPFLPLTPAPGMPGAWKNLNGNLNTTQNYAVALHPTNPAMLINGSHDNGNAVTTNAWAAGAPNQSATWTTTAGGGGDGLWVRFAPSDGNKAYKVDNTGNFATWHAPSSLFDKKGIPGTGAPGRSLHDGWNPFAVDPNDANHVIIGGDGGFLLESTSVNQAPTTWTEFSPGSARQSPVTCVVFAPRTAILNAFQLSFVVFVGYRDGVVRRYQVTQGQAPTFVEAAPRFAPRPVSGIAVDTVDSRLAAITFEGRGMYQVQEYTFDVRAATRTPLIEGPENNRGVDAFPNLRAHAIVVDRPVVIDAQGRVSSQAAPVFYVGTETGVFRGDLVFNPNTRLRRWVWERLDPNSVFPNVDARDLQLQRYASGSTVLAAATYGRGIWSIDVTRPIAGVQGVIPGDDNFRVLHDQPLTVTAGTSSYGLLDNDLGYSGGTLSITAVNGDPLNLGQSVSVASGATVVVLADGSLAYTPSAANPGFTGTETFTYDFTDGVATGTAIVTIKVLGQSPLAFADTYTVSHDQVLQTSFDLGPDGLLANDFGTSRTVSAVDGQSANVGAPVALSSGALVTVNADGSMTYVSAPNAVYTESFSYEISDGSNTSTAWVTINVINQTPQTENDGITTDEDTPLTIAAPGPLLNDWDPDAADNVSVITIANNGNSAGAGQVLFLASGATLQINGDGTLAYDPTCSTTLNQLPVGQTATEQVVYTISDPLGLTATGTLTITVLGVNDLPVITMPSDQTINEDVPLQLGANIGNLISIADVDAADQEILVTITATNGSSTWPASMA